MQHGFRTNHSCETAQQSIFDTWKKSIDDHEVVLSLFVDFKKAFDLINPELLFHKMVHYGFNNNALAFIMTYFSNRKQVTIVDTEQSLSCDLSIGVPQGSVLGPLLFLVYINDLSYTTELTTYLFADDTTMFDSRKYLPTLQVG